MSVPGVRLRWPAPNGEAVKGLAPLFTVLIVIGALVKFIWVVALIIGLPLFMFALYFGYICWEHQRDLRRHEREGICARADQQYEVAGVRPERDIRRISAGCVTPARADEQHR